MYLTLITVGKTRRKRGVEGEGMIGLEWRKQLKHEYQGQRLRETELNEHQLYKTSHSIFVIDPNTKQVTQVSWVPLHRWRKCILIPIYFSSRVWFAYLWLHLKHFMPNLAEVWHKTAFWKLLLKLNTSMMARVVYSLCLMRRRLSAHILTERLSGLHYTWSKGD